MDHDYQVVEEATVPSLHSAYSSAMFLEDQENFNSSVKNHRKRVKRRIFSRFKSSRNEEETASDFSRSELRSGSGHTGMLTEDSEEHDSIQHYQMETQMLKATSSSKTSKKFKRRSSLAKAASSIFTTLEAPRTWFSLSATENSNPDDSSQCRETEKEDDSCRKEIFPSHSDFSPQYAIEQAQLQASARKAYHDGQLESAIMYWKQSLELAESKREVCSLSSLTEILCMLAVLHFLVGEQIKPTSRRPATCERLQLDSVSFTSTYEHTCDTETDHKKEAEKYLHRIKPVMVQAQWLCYETSFLDFLCEAKSWELALVVAKRLVKKSKLHHCSPGDDLEKETQSLKALQSEKLAVLHFNVASLKIQKHKQGEALQHLQIAVQYFRDISIDGRDMTMYLQALQLLAAEYQRKGQSSLALDAYKEQQKHVSSIQSVRISCQMAEIYISDSEFNLALEELESAYNKHEKSPNEEQGDNANIPIGVIRSQLLQLKGDVYCRLGKMEESMKVYKQAFREVHDPADKAKLLYIMGRLYTRMGRIQSAISCFTQELNVTERELGANHLSVSGIYHELAKLYDEGLGLHRVGIQKYDKALQIELAVLEDIQSTVRSCSQCSIETKNNMCDTHASIFAQVEGQVRETKKCLGRVHFKLGDFDGAVKAGLVVD